MIRTIFVAALLSLALAAPAAAQLGGLGSKLGKAGKVVDKAKDARQAFVFTESEEVQVGSEISAKLRDKYGVVQDASVHKYVALLGTALAAESSRPNLKWTFVVLDTDGINAFAAPGGFVHITRGALALIQNESELAGVLGHEITHVTEKDTIKAIQNAKRMDLGAQVSRSEVLSQAADTGFDVLFQNQFSRDDEIHADGIGIALANKAGYAPGGLGAFLQHLLDRNKNLKEPSGLYASHPDTQARLTALKQAIAKQKLVATAMVQPRYRQHISFTLAPVESLAAGGVTSAAATEKKSGGLGLGGMKALGREKSSDQTVSSAGSRGVNPDRDAKGGPVKTLVSVSVSKAEVAEFRKGITG